MKYTIRVYQVAEPSDANWEYEVKRDRIIAFNGGGHYTASAAVADAALSLVKHMLAILDTDK